MLFFALAFHHKYEYHHLNARTNGRDDCLHRVRFWQIQSSNSEDDEAHLCTCLLGISQRPYLHSSHWQSEMD